MLTAESFYEALHKAGFVPVNEVSYEGGPSFRLSDLFENGCLLCRPIPPKNLMTMRGNLEVITHTVSNKELIDEKCYVSAYSIPSLDLQRIIYGKSRFIRKIDLNLRRKTFYGLIEKYLEELKTKNE